MWAGLLGRGSFRKSSKVLGVLLLGESTSINDAESKEFCAFWASLAALLSFLISLAFLHFSFDGSAPIPMKKVVLLYN